MTPDELRAWRQQAGLSQPGRPLIEVLFPDEEPPVNTAEQITNVASARNAGVRLMSNGHSVMNRGTVRVVHARPTSGGEFNETLCHRLLREPNPIGAQQALQQYTLCSTCQRLLNATR